MPSTSRSMSAFAANLLVLLTMAPFGKAAASIEIGCYSSSEPLTSIGTYTFQSSGYCQTQCVNQNQPVFGLSNGDECWCGSELPAANTKADSSSCDSPCTGYGQSMCGGGTDFFSIYLTGEQTNVPTYSGNSSSSTTSSSSPTTESQRPGRTTARPSVVTSVAPGKTLVITQVASASSSAATAKSSSSSGSTNVAGIAAGVVVGIVAVASIVAGVFFWMRHRRRRAEEDEIKRTQVPDFLRGGERKPPQTGYSSMSDSRLDPEAGQRRNSQGSIADAADYSRKILRVANPDRS